MRILFLISFILIGTRLGYSQEAPIRITLEEAINYALAHNYSAINADRDMVDAQKQKWETIASGLPQIDGSVGYQNQLKQPVSLLPGELAGGEPGTFIPITFGQPQQINAAATLRQKIFDGSYIVGVQATRAFLEYSANNREKTQLEVRKAVVNAYGNVLLAIETVDILEKNKASLEKSLFETQKLYENGLGDEESAEQLQITLSSIENDLRNATRLQKITHQMLNLTIGLDIDSPTILEEDLPELTAKQTIPELLTDTFDVTNNVDYKIAYNLTEQRFFEHKLARSRALPTLNAFVNYGSASYSDSFNFTGSDAEWFDSSVLGLDLNIPIFSSLARTSSTQRAKIAMLKAQTQLVEAEQQIKLELQKAKSDYEFAIEQYQTAQENLRLAERIERKNDIKYTEGLATSFELRQAQMQLYTTQQEYLQSMVTVINNKTILETLLNN